MNVDVFSENSHALSKKQLIIASQDFKIELVNDHESCRLLTQAQLEMSCLLEAKGNSTSANCGNNTSLTHRVTNVRIDICRVPLPCLAHNQCSINDYNY